MDTKNVERTYYSFKDKTLILNLQIQPKASQNAIIGVHNNKLKIALTSAPTDGKANEHLIKYLAKHFGVPKNQVKIIKGAKSRQKSVLISSPQKNLEDFS